MGIYRKLCTVCNLSSGCVKCREDWDYNGNSNDGFLCDHHGMVGNYDITTSENLSPEVLCRKEAACFFRKLQKNRHYTEKCKEGEEGFSVPSGVFLYIDGVYTIIDMATAYGSALGLSSTGLLLALLLTQIVAFPFAIIFGRLAKKYSAEKLITVCIVAYLGVAIFAIFLHYQWQFWVLAVWVGMFQGGVQALSRSYFTKIIPANQSGEFFGLMDICGKGASFMGTTIVSLISQLTGNINIGVGMIAVLFVIGIILFRRAAALE